MQEIIEAVLNEIREIPEMGGLNAEYPHIESGAVVHFEIRFGNQKFADFRVEGTLLTLVLIWWSRGVWSDLG